MNSQPQPLEDDSCMARYYRQPVMTRGICTMLVWIWMLGAVLYPDLDMRLSGCPAGILSLEIWRWFTSPFVAGGLIGVLIGVLVFGNIGGQFERTFGSLAFGYLFVLFNVLANVAFTLLVLLAAPLFPSMGLLSPMNCANGVWVSVLGFLVVYTQRLNTPHMSFWGLCNIPTKLYPWFLLLLFGLLGGSFLDNLCGIMVGYAFHFGYLTRLLPSEQRFQAWEAAPRLTWITQAPGHLTYTGSLWNAAGAGEDGGGGLGNWGSSGGGQSQSRTGNIMSGGVIRPGANSQAPAGGGAGGGGGGAFSAFQGAGQSLGSTPAGPPSSSWSMFSSSSSASADPAAGGGGGERPMGRLFNSVAGDNRGTYAVIPPPDQSTAPSSSHASASQSSGVGDFHDKVQRLCDMGFTPTLAAAALREHNGDMDAAVASLAV